MSIADVFAREALTMFRWILVAAGLLISIVPAAGRTQPPVPSFAATVPPPAPDYDTPAAWASRPSGAASERMRGVDVFYVHPTTYHGAGWNQDIADAEANAQVDQGVMRTQASAFDACCRVFAPRYRQAAGRAFSSMYGDGGLAYDLAYQDVARAFETYLRRDNHGRPFILAGHSQGALQVLRLLEERIDGRPEQKRLVAAYVVGIGVSRGAFGKALKHIPACATPTQTGCVLTWNTFEEGRDPTAYIADSEVRYTRRFGDYPDKALVCINPLTFDAATPSAGVDRHLGAVILTPPPGPAPAPVARAVTAHCQDGVLRAAAPTGAVKLTPLPNGSLHMQDMELFWGNIRADAQTRGEHFLALAKGGRP